jgi:cell division protein FtsI (penicillin-binding protein 3)
MEDKKRDILWRVYLVYFGLVLFAVLIIWKVFRIQFAEKEALMQKAKEQEIEYFTLEATRGNILARDGSLLAISIPIFEIRMDVNSELISDKFFYDKVDSLSMCLANLFEDKSKAEYRRDLTEARQKGNRYFLVKNHVSYPDLKELRRFPIFRLGKYRGGLIVVRKTTREMPYEDLARRTIGFENSEKGYFVGLEGAYSEYLRGKDGKQLKRRINSGDWIPVADKPDIEPEDGMDILTTIDVNLQDVAEQSLLKNLEENEAFQGCAILMEVNTGEIHAIANLRYDPKDGRYKEIYNYAIGESVEPGSTFKLASVIAALEDGKATPNTMIDVGNGSVTYYNRTMKDVHHFPTSFVTLQQVFEESSNVGISKLITNAYRNEPERYVEHLRRMGLDKPLGIEIPGEGKPYIKDPSDKQYWYGTTLPWMSVGYELTLTPLQVLALYNAVANDGVMVKPLFVKEIQDGGVAFEKHEPVVLNPSICSEKTLREVRSMLEGVVDHGTAKGIKDSLFRIAGKTGTALVANKDQGYANKEYNASFVGYFPADNPKYSCIVVVNRPNSGKIYGGSVAAPVFKEIAEKVYATQYDIQQERKATYSAKVSLPDTTPGNTFDLKTCFTALNYTVSTSALQPEWTQSMGEHNRIIFEPLALYPDTVPDLTGMNLKDAVFLLENRGLVPIVRGKGYVQEQSVMPGTPVIKGSEIILKLANGKS